jgi:hypothetical protein
MSMETIDKHLITQFSDSMHVVAQQTKARLRPYTQVLKINGDRFAYDGIGDVEAKELTGRFNKVEWDDIEFFRRKITRRRFVVTLPLDEMDVEGMLTDPSSPLATACTRAMERVYDRVVVDAMFADVQTGRDFENTVTAAQDGVLTVNATGGLTLAKLLEPNQNFIDNEVGNDEDVSLVMGISGAEHTTMLQLQTLTSRDYSSNMSLEKGKITNVVGMDLVRFGAKARRPVLPVVAGVRSSFVMSKGAVVVGISRGWNVTVKDRADYVDTKQIQVVGVLGAVRTEGKLIQKFTTTA